MALRKISLSMVAIAALTTGAFADDAASASYGNGLADAFTKGKVDGQVRGMYIMQNTVATNNQPNNNNSGFALGGNLGFTTAPYYGVTAGVKAYTSQALATSSGFAGSSTKGPAYMASYMENTGVMPAQSYTVLGQAYVQGVYGKTILKIGRQQLDTPLAGADDNYMIPNLFQAAVLINQDLPQTTLIAAYVNGMMGGTTGDSHAGALGGITTGQTGFASMSRSALGSIVDIGSNMNGTGTTIGNTPVFALAALNSSIPYTNLGAWYYNNTNVLQAWYLNADVAVPVTKTVKPYGAVQYYNLAAQGTLKQLLTNLGNVAPTLGVNNLSYSVTGIKIGTSTPIGLTPEVAANFVGGKTGSVYAFNAWGGTPNYTDMAFTNLSTFAQYAGGLIQGGANPKGMNIWKYSLTEDLSTFGLGNRNIQLAYGTYGFVNSNNGGQNMATAVWDVVYNCKGALVKNLDVQAYYENIMFRNNQGWTTQTLGGLNMKSTNVVMLKGIYNF